MLTFRDACGCIFYDSNPPEIKRCPLHEAAGKMRDVLRELTIDHESDCPALTAGPYAVGACDCTVGKARQAAAALLAMPDKGGSAR